MIRRDREPVRTCVGCRQSDAQSLLVRVVLDPAGRVRPDGSTRAAGRGAYLHRDRGCFEKAASGGGLSRSFRKKTPGLDSDKLWIAVSGIKDKKES